MEYYERLNPTDDPHSRAIQDDLRRQAAIAVAGEIAEGLLGHGSCVAESEVAQDRELARCRASFIHFWSESRCRAEGQWESGVACPHCDDFLGRLRSVVEAQLLNSTVSRQVVGLATVLDERNRLDWGEVTGLVKGDLAFGSLHVDALPSAPSR